MRLSAGFIERRVRATLAAEPVSILSIIAAGIIAASVIPDALSAQTAPPMPGQRSGASSVFPSHAAPVPSAFAERRSTPIAIDGVLNEAAWERTTPVTEFRQVEPDAGEPASERIEVRFLFDDDALYVGARMYDRAGRAGVTSTVVRRDAFFNSDFFEIVVDGFHDHLSRAFFQVNPSGSKTDLIGIGTSCCDDGWDPVWEAATKIDDEGWVAEIRIPYSQLRFSRDSLQTWGLQIRRFIRRRSEVDQWSYWGKNESGGPHRFGHLEGLQIAQSSRHVELLPYVMGKSARLLARPGDPFNDGSVQSVRAGLDVRYGLTPNLTLDATFNPDFGQVEVDPAVVNLSAFETFFQERRPFFVSGAGVFSYGGFSCYFCSNTSSLQAFYSRRVGRAPTGADLASTPGGYADVPEASTILGAAKITGRTRSGYTVGFMNAVTGRANATVQLADGSRRGQEVEPLANYFVARAKRDLRGGNLVLGLIGSGIIRDTHDEFTARLAKHAELVGGDFQYTWGNRTYSLQGNAAVSNVSGDSRVILARQQSSARFYQRPDRVSSGDGSWLRPSLDPDATSMQGAGTYLRVGKNSGAWMWETATNIRTPGFETNDYSFLTQADYIWNNANVFRYWSTPTRYYRELSVIAGGQRQQNFSGDVTDNTQLHVYIGGQTPQFWRWNTFYIWKPAGLYDDRLLRGGPSVRTYQSNFYSLNVSTDSRKQWSLSTNPSFRTTAAGVRSTNLNLFANFQPSTRLFLSMGPSFSDSRGRFQYVSAVTDPTATGFAGTRYVLSDLNQRQLGFETRVNVTFSPTMTLEVYAQPFFASQHFSAFKEFDAPRSSAYAVYGRDRGTVSTTTNADGHVTSYTIDPDGGGPASSFTLQNPDFNFRSLRGNAVYRWEYRPGSTLYLVWTQDRHNTASTGTFDFGRDRDALVRTRPDNIFLVKATWWLAR
jgi:hypothetical protein